MDRAVSKENLMEYLLRNERRLKVNILSEKRVVKFKAFKIARTFHTTPLKVLDLLIELKEDKKIKWFKREGSLICVELALSPVIAILLLLAITTSLAVLLYVTLCGAVPTILGGAVSYGYESISIDCVTLNEDGSFIIIVRNTGDVKTIIDSVYLLDYLTESFVAKAELLYVNGGGYDRYSIEPGQVIELSGTFSTSLCGTYRMKIVTVTGVEATTIVVVRD